MKRPQPLICWVFYFMEKNCSICLTIFKVKPSHYDKRFCCSKECQNIRQKNKVGVFNSNYKGVLKTQNCNQCKKNFIPNNPYQKRKYCSHKCSTDFNIGIKKPLHRNTIIALKEIHKISKLETDKKRLCICGCKKDIKAKTCIYCFKVNNSKKQKICKKCNVIFKPNHNSNIFCSKTCFKSDLKLKYKTENNPNWKGGVKNSNQVGRYSADYYVWISEVFKRDDYTCQICFKIGNKLNAHHIKPWSKFPLERLNIDNGLTLCYTCHRTVHTINKHKVI